MKQRKGLIRRIAVFLVAVIIFGNVGKYNCTSVKAENIYSPLGISEKEADIYITTDKVNGKKGDIITLTFTYTGLKSIIAIDFDINFDTSLLSLYNYEQIPINRICDILHHYEDEKYFNMYTHNNNKDCIGEGEQFLSMQFKCLKDIDKETIIKFTTVGFYFYSPMGEYFYEEGYSVKINPINTGIPSPIPSGSPLPTVSPSPAPSGSPLPAVSPSPAPSIPTGSAVIPDCNHLFNDYDYTSPVKGSPVFIYGNGINKKIDGNVVNNKQFTAYTDILPSYNYTLNSKGMVKPSSGKVIAGITTSSTKPVVSKNKIVDREASKIAKARIKNGQVTVTAAGKEKGLVYLWIIDTGKNGTYECCPVNVLMAPLKLEVQDSSGSKLKSPSISQGASLDVCVAGIAPGGKKTDDCTYTATVADASQGPVKVTPVPGKNGQFKITVTGLKNNKNTKVSIIFTCNENKKKIKLAATIKK